LTWIDRSGRVVGALGQPGFFGSPRLSPDGRKVAVDVDDPDRETADVWIYDVASGGKTRFGAVFGSAFQNAPVWSSNGDRIAFASDRRARGRFSLFAKAINGAVEEVLLESPDQNGPEDWSSDGRYLSFSTMRAEGKRNTQLWVLDTSGERKPFPLASDALVQEDSRFSPDGRWIAYKSDESGTFEIYVRPFPGPGGKWQVSTAGGSNPRWRRDGKELFYLGLDNKIMAVPVRLDKTFHAGSPVALFESQPLALISSPYDVSADGQRFLMNTASGPTGSPPLTLLTDWTALLKE
jgi:Tol biopolymer transport system component